MIAGLTPSVARALARQELRRRGCSAATPPTIFVDFVSNSAEQSPTVTAYRAHDGTVQHRDAGESDEDFRARLAGAAPGGMLVADQPASLTTSNAGGFAGVSDGTP